jgi:hypothetical protein
MAVMVEDEEGSSDGGSHFMALGFMMDEVFCRLFSWLVEI